MFKLTPDGALTAVVADAIEGQIIEMPHVHNGVAFSEGAKARAAGRNGQMFLKGPLIPDQARLAFQVGFDALLLDDDAVARHGFDAWRHALEASLSATYLYPSAQGAGDQLPLWQRRFQKTL